MNEVLRHAPRAARLPVAFAWVIGFEAERSLRAFGKRVMSAVLVSAVAMLRYIGQGGLSYALQSRALSCWRWLYCARALGLHCTYNFTIIQLKTVFANWHKFLL